MNHDQFFILYIYGIWMYWELIHYVWFVMQIEYPEIEDMTKPRHRFMSSYEQVRCAFFICIKWNWFTMYIWYQNCMLTNLSFDWCRESSHLTKNSSIFYVQLNLMRSLHLRLICCTNCFSFDFHFAYGLFQTIYLLFICTLCVRFQAQRLTNQLPSSFHIGIQTQKCSRFVLFHIFYTLCKIFRTRKTLYISQI